MNPWFDNTATIVPLQLQFVTGEHEVSPCKKLLSYLDMHYDHMNIIWACESETQNTILYRFWNFGLYLKRIFRSQNHDGFPISERFDKKLHRLMLLLLPLQTRRTRLPISWYWITSQTLQFHHACNKIPDSLFSEFKWDSSTWTPQNKCNIISDLKLITLRSVVWGATEDQNLCAPS